MVISKLKKVLIYLIAIIIFSSGFLGLNLTKIEATSNNATDLAGCTQTINREAMNNFANNSIDMVPMEFPNGGTPINQGVEFKESQPYTRRNYTFNFEKFDAIDLGSTTDKHGVYTYSSEQFSDSKLVFDAGAGNTIRTLNLKGGYAGFINPEAGDTYYQKYVKVFNENIKNFSFTCTHGDLFPNGDINTEISFRGDSPPVIKLRASQESGRPEVTVFQLKDVLNKVGWAPNDVIFEFPYLKNDNGTVDPQFAHFVIKLFGKGGNSFLAECSDLQDYKSCEDYGENKNIIISNRSLQLFWNHVYNSAGTGTADTTTCGTATTYQSSNSTDATKDKNLATWTIKPDIACLNADTTGWLAKWGIKVNTVSLTNQAGELSASTCGLPITQALTTEYWIARALCGVLNIIGNLAKMIVDGLFYTVFEAYHPPDNLKLSALTSVFNISQAHAEPTPTPTKLENTSVSPLSKAFTNQPGPWAWVIKIWKFVLVLTDLFLVVILLFLGIVNILHIQYDTYAIKKMLPLLIIGVILANFSLLIMRMLIDAANILTSSFMGQSPGEAVYNLIYDFGLSENQLPAFASGWSTVGGLFLAVFFSFFAIAAFFILGVMFYIRYAAILLLGIAAPLAFVALAFPPTQSLFKQWWSWTVKFVFMKPIAMFLIFVAIEAKRSGAGTGIVGWMIIIALVYFAILVPWKLGGAISAAWGGAMGSIFGTKKGGWARKPVDDWWQRRKDQAGAKAKMRLPWLFAGAERDRLNTEEMKKRADARVKTQAEKNPSVATWRGRAKQAEIDLKDLQALQDHAYARSELKMSLLLRASAGGIKWENGKPKLVTGKDLAKGLADSEVDLALDTKDFEATKKDLLQQGVIARIRKARKLMTQITDMQEKDIGMKAYDKNTDGTLKEATGKLGNYQTTMELVTQLEMEALSLGPEETEKARNLMASALKLRQEADQFAKDHDNFQNEAVHYENFMDKQYYGRGLSLTSPVAAEDSQVLANYESAESMRERLEKGGGNRNERFGPPVPVHYFRGEHDQISDYELSAFVPDVGAHAMLLGRGSTQDRAANLASLLSYFKEKVFTQEEFQQFMDTFLRAEEMLPGREGLTRGFMAEQLMAAHSRGAPLPEGLEDIDLSGVQRVSDVVEKLKPHDKKIKDYLTAHPEFLASVEMSSPWGARNTMSFMLGYADNLVHSPFLGGPGNMISNSVGPGFTPKKFYEKLLSRDQSTLENLSKRREQELAAAERTAEIGRTLATTPPSQLARDPSSAARIISMPEAKKANDNFLENQTATASRFKVDKKKVSPEGFRQIATAILSSSAETAKDLKSELQAQFAGLSFKITPELRTPEGFAAFKNELATSINGADCYSTLENSAYAQDAIRSVPVRSDETREQLAASVQNLEEATIALKSAFEQIKTSGGEIPKNVQDKYLDAISQRQQVTPLTKELLLERPEKASDVLQKMMVVLKAALKVKESPEGILEEKFILKQIQKDLNQKRGIPTEPPTSPSPQTPPTADGNQTPGGSTTAPTE